MIAASAGPRGADGETAARPLSAGRAMTAPAWSADGGDLEPGWSRDKPNPYGPCYRRHVPGKGVLRVAARGPSRYAWYLSTASRSDSLSWAREGFAHPRDAMRDADHQVSRMAPRMFEHLTPGEARELYRELAKAYDWGDDGPGYSELAEVRSELATQIVIHASDPSYTGPAPHTFTHAVRVASYGAALEAMAASRNRSSWLSTPRRQQRGRPAVPRPPSPAAPGPRPRGPR